MGRVMNFIVRTLIIYCVFALPLAILIGKTIKSVDDMREGCNGPFRGEIRDAVFA
jgi:hypothetical protein